MKTIKLITIVSIVLIIFLTCPSVFPNTNGAINGTVHYNGAKIGQIKIIAIAIPPDKTNPFNYTILNEAGPFEISSLNDGLYFVGAFMDIDGNNLPHYNEPLGVYRHPIYIANNNVVTGVNFSLYDLPRGTSMIEGKITYPGIHTGKIYVVTLGISPTPITINTLSWDNEHTYQIQSLAGGKYIVAAYMDSDGNGLPGLAEPIGLIKEFITLKNGEIKNVNDIALIDRSMFAGSIEGSITYDGPKTGKPYVICAGVSPTPLSLGSVTSEGNYKIKNLAPGNYRLFAYLDCNKNIIYNPGEPYSESYLCSICVEPDANVKDVNLTLMEYSTGSLSGTLSYNGSQQGLITTVALGLSPTPINITMNLAPGIFKFNKLASGIYAVGSFIDSNGNLLPDFQDPLGLYTKNIIIVKDGINTPNINITLDDTPEASISGNIINSNNSKGRIFLGVTGFSTTPFKLSILNETGPYNVAGLGYGKYIMAAFRDLNSNGMFDVTEPYTFTNYIINVQQDTETPGIDLILFTDIERLQSTVEEKNNITLTDNYILQPNYPNPFNPNTVINYQVPEQALVTIKIFNILGKEIITLVNEQKSKGNYSVFWDAKDKHNKKVSSGIYIYWMQAGDFSDIRKMTLVQ